MPAPKGNQYFKFRQTDGRHKIWETVQDFETALNDWETWLKQNPLIKKDFIKSGEMAGTIIDIEVPRPATIESFCQFHGITTDTFRNYEKNDSYKDFFGVLKYAREKIENMLFEQASVNNQNAMLAARKLGLKEKQDITSNDQSISLNVNVSNPGLSKDLDKE